MVDMGLVYEMTGQHVHSSIRQAAGMEDCKLWAPCDPIVHKRALC